MTTHYAGGCEHVHVTASAEPIDNHECHCNVCKSVTGQQHTHVAFFNHADIQVDHPELIKRSPFNAQNPNGPLEICQCTKCDAVLMLDDKQGRIRVAVRMSWATTTPSSQRPPTMRSGTRRRAIPPRMTAARSFPACSPALSGPLAPETTARDGRPATLASRGQCPYKPPVARQAARLNQETPCLPLPSQQGQFRQRRMRHETE
ncbi:MAG: hypothetical protein NTW20_08700 [Rhodobacterales bacterium]|nr:hypothetical protein [Rhodobacterales bacterium]